MTLVCRKRLVALVYNLAAVGIDHSLVVPVLQAVDNPVELHPAPGLTMEVVAYRLFNGRSLFSWMTGFTS